MLRKIVGYFAIAGKKFLDISLCAETIIYHQIAEKIISHFQVCWQVNYQIPQITEKEIIRYFRVCWKGNYLTSQIAGEEILSYFRVAEKEIISFFQ